MSSADICCLHEEDAAEQWASTSAKRLGRAGEQIFGISRHLLFSRQIGHGVRGFYELFQGGHHCGAGEELAEEIDFAAELAIWRAWPSAASCATRPTDCARAALTLRPVRSRSRTKALPGSRLRRGMPPKPGIRPKRSSGKAKRAILSAMMRSHVRASSKPPPKQTP